MNDQNAVAQLHQKMVNVRKAVGYIQKKGVNEGQGYNFARASDFYDKVREALDHEGIATTVESDLQHVETYQAANKKGVVSTWQRVIVRLTMVFTDAATGAMCRASALGAGADNGDKAIPKANTGAEKYILAETFIISTGDDPEASREADEATTPPPPSQGAQEGTQAPAGAPAAKRAGKKPTKGETTLAGLLARLAALDLADQAAVNQFRLDGTAQRESMTQEQWLELKAALTARMAPAGGN